MRDLVWLLPFLLLLGRLVQGCDVVEQQARVAGGGGDANVEQDLPCYGLVEAEPLDLVYALENPCSERQGRPATVENVGEVDRLDASFWYFIALGDVAV